MVEDTECKVEFDKDFAPNERLFHYTSSQGLYGILESGCLWATHFRFLNDSNEFFAAKKSLTEFVEREVRKKIAALKVNGEIKLEKGISVADLSKHEADVIVSAMYSATLKISDPFIFSSFVSSVGIKSFRNGELLHWATYGRDGGYALEINPHKLALLFKECKDQSLLSQKAVYVDDVAPVELAEEYSAIGKFAQDMLVAMLSDKWDACDIGASAAPFTRIASRIKDGYFRSENEARLVALRSKTGPEGYSPPTVHIRHTKAGATPYIKLFEGILLKRNCPIDAIIIGPHSDNERRKEALSIFLEGLKLSNIEIVQSKVPYIGG